MDSTHKGSTNKQTAEFQASHQQQTNAATFYIIQHGELKPNRQQQNKNNNSKRATQKASTSAVPYARRQRMTIQPEMQHHKSSGQQHKHNNSTYERHANWDITSHAKTNNDESKPQNTTRTVGYTPKKTKRKQAEEALREADLQQSQRRRQ